MLLKLFISTNVTISVTFSLLPFCY